MFFKKKEVKKNSYDLTCERLQSEMAEQLNLLVNYVPQVIGAVNVVALYPEGPDKKKAEEDANKKREGLRNRIAHYDTAQADYERFLKDTEGKREYTAEWWNRYLSSHEVVENAWKNFFKK